MALCCDLQVDVNGEETFMVDMKIVASYSGRLSKLFGMSMGAAKNCKLIFNDFPGGPKSFELMSKFCYNNGTIDITPSNVSLLHSAAQFMEMKSSTSRTCNLLEQTERSLQEINYWTWSELLVTVRQCQDLLPLANCSSIIEKCIDSFIGRIASSSESSPCQSISSPDSSGFWFSSDTKSTESLKSNISRVTWWFEDLLVLSPNLIEVFIKSMVTRKVDHVIISRFLFYYQKSRFFDAASDQKHKIVETVVDMLYVLDLNSVSCKSLFGMLRVASSLNVNKSSRNKLESMIGSQMDQATLDNLLIPSPRGTCYLYDMNLVLRFLKAFLCRGIYQVSPMRLQKVGSLMDLYMAEVAPDPCLKPSKFLALAMALPDSARDSYDGIYRALDMYLEVHAGLPEDEKMKMYCALNYGKLSAEVLIHLSKNKNFSSKSAVQAHTSQQIKLKSILQADNEIFYCDLPSSLDEIGFRGNEDGASQQIVPYAGKLGVSTDNDKLKAHLQRMQWRVRELEKVCRKMHIQMTKIMKSRASNHISARTLPKLCS